MAVGTFNKEKALVGALAFSVIVKLREGSFAALVRARPGCMCRVRDYAAQPVAIIKTYAGAWCLIIGWPSHMSTGAIRLTIYSLRTLNPDCLDI